MNLPSIGGNDFHTGVQVGSAIAKFENHVGTMDALIAEMKVEDPRGVFWGE